MTKTDSEVYQVVDELNNLLWKKYQEEEFQFKFSSNGYYNAILFNDYMLWYSDEDDREFNEETNDYEPLKEFIIKEFNKYISHLKRLKL